MSEAVSSAIKDTQDRVYEAIKGWIEADAQSQVHLQMNNQ